MASMGCGCISYSETWSVGSPYAGSAKIRLIRMGLLDQLWDDTVAGPRPENGLGKLRKHHTFTFRPSYGKEPEGGSARSYGDESSEDAMRVTRSIMIVKPPGYQSGSPPVSPAGSTPPVSPFSGGKDSFRFRRRSASDAYEKRGQNRSGPSSPFDV
ncbi:Dormancyauxin associated [Spatholobus suberectus]|nr:Dormancyauxin associated [Spatholobus suberectus]